MTVSVEALGRVEIVDWPRRQLPMHEIQAALSYVAHKTRRPVRVSVYRGALQYSDKIVHFHFCTPESGAPLPRITRSASSIRKRAT